MESPWLKTTTSARKPPGLGKAQTRSIGDAFGNQLKTQQLIVARLEGVFGNGSALPNDG